MSCFRMCDGGDCQNSENEGLFDISNDIESFIKNEYKYGKYYDSSVDDLCQSCIDNINECYPENKEALILDEYDDYILNENRGECD